MGNVVVVNTGIATVMVGQQVVMITRMRTTPDAAISVRALIMNGISQALGDNVPLEGKVFHAIERRTLVGTPADGAMVNNDFLERITILVHYLHGIVLGLLLVTHTATDKAHNHVTGMNAEGIVSN